MITNLMHMIMQNGLNQLMSSYSGFGGVYAGNTNHMDTRTPQNHASSGMNARVASGPNRVDEYGIKFMSTRKPMNVKDLEGSAGSPSRNIRREPHLGERIPLDNDYARLDKSRAGGQGPHDISHRLTGNAIGTVHDKKAFGFKDEWTPREARFHQQHQGIRPTDPLGVHKDPVGSPSFQRPLSIYGTEMQSIASPKNGAGRGGQPSAELQRINASKSGLMTTLLVEETPSLAGTSFLSSRAKPKPEPSQPIRDETRRGVMHGGISNESHQMRDTICSVPLPAQPAPTYIPPRADDRMKITREMINQQHYAHTQPAQVKDIYQNNAQARSFLKSRDRGSDCSWFYHQ